MPNVFNQMPAGQLFGTLFYVLFFLAALTSFIGAFEGLVAFVRDNLGLARESGVWLVGIVVMLIATVSAYSQEFFGMADYVANNVLLILGALMMTVFVGWVWGIAKAGAAVVVDDVPHSKERAQWLAEELE